uniref:Large ribosomal subunit protein uL14m n=1 Tax=Elaeophora elaphi TaxID=1147741 RepID=A0A0R3S2N0_9BILA
MSNLNAKMPGLAVCNIQRLAVPDVCLHISKALASGRWWPQPSRGIHCRSNNMFSCFTYIRKLGNSASSEEMEQTTATNNVTERPAARTFAESGAALLDTATSKSPFLELSPETAAPIYAKPRGTGKNIYKTEIGEDGQQIANYVLFEDSMAKAKVAWQTYSGMTAEERDIYMAHLKAIRERRFSYKDPKGGFSVKTVSQHLLRGKCCGSGCRHCPFQHENAALQIRKSKIWNELKPATCLQFLPCFRYELSRHRTRPPSTGIERRTRLLVVDNSALGKEANTSGKLAYCIDVYKPGGRKKHMPHARLGDKILVAIRGEMKQAFVVGAKIHVDYRKHGIPSTDTNNIVLLDDEGNPLGTRVLMPIPAVLQRKRANLQFSKILSIATKYF